MGDFALTLGNLVAPRTCRYLVSGMISMKERRTAFRHLSRSSAVACTLGYSCPSLSQFVVSAVHIMTGQKSVE